ncbi:hypothetical protein LTR91_003179 [Friedmanniomyces endolithicus]|uniref:Uncharacterized protein n=1 Tax=Friedmanniomyces endolithicus TaxID=329885 RepID=A0AAN6QYX4_9PEZI|nr:hypothetical protein LTS00_016025 [Friedmanniomyces endolithicus]KAK0274201.1 hypothetical protein LTR35_011710 [Friedmanniomyces endolithicus]KAK0311733.1 hypothetical protein LTR82_014105 [Friedmanniomyces endolithicus]KAK0910976.1 hypothetical protein LTR57_015610 [Friedmanniomyces endolithicus]KAK0983587.1 hypothetical protein LTR54_014252 [Friedmanniomyces endolithicus]
MKRKLKRKYKIKIVDTNLFLGLHITNLGYCKIKISQKHYSKEKVKGHSLDQAKTVKYLLDRRYAASGN